MSKRPDPLERDECKALVDWMRIRGLTFVHVPNERIGPSHAELQALKNIGLQPEFPDYLIFDTPTSGSVDCRGVALEMKRTGERPTPGQLRWLRLLSGLGWLSFWFDSADEAIEELGRIYSP